ncbi:uncharacterized protein PGTG_17347 [Puccinia graminis f. sp. tritici CRL 75-36-700-3]|uniref:Uncharacterized protein n=2 Tax=Puccinia graminis f. sp. tritici TaxID=56615 RepID=E3L4B6_PUCGT|nr:uncharacterized protein PGTG_17347 [Puccinia graminis f. sp. tritici CRL 75-36-700-3]EFP91391.2 hypothetical protein PGTG_17347 [Puccinia graminis f. sp. tritici CRL 75-36-700-3]
MIYLLEVAVSYHMIRTLQVPVAPLKVNMHGVMRCNGHHQASNDLPMSIFLTPTFLTFILLYCNLRIRGVLAQATVNMSGTGTMLKARKQRQ